MPRVRVLVVDDSVTVRRLLVDALSVEPDLEVVGTAANGVLALEQLERLHPDLIVLDLDMPVMDGHEFLTRMRRRWPRLPVIVFSSFTAHGAEATLQALWNGASDYVMKPKTPDVGSALRHTRAELLPRIRAFARPGSGAAQARQASSTTVPAKPGPARTTHAPEPAPPEARPSGERRPGAPRASVIAIGASTGGPRALAEVVGVLPADVAAPILIVQHMPAMFTRLLADGLSEHCEMPVREAEHGMPLEAGTVWVAPGDHHLTVGRDGALPRLWLDREPQENGCRPSVNPLFRSVAEAFGSGALAIVLTGMGQDGLDGARSVRAHGGQVLVQDEATSVVWGMPGVVARAGLADAVLPLEEIGPEILARVRRAGRRAA